MSSNNGTSPYTPPPATLADDPCHELARRLASPLAEAEARTAAWEAARVQEALQIIDPLNKGASR